jgi:nucleoid-associated protein YgaU
MRAVLTATALALTPALAAPQATPTPATTAPAPAEKPAVDLGAAAERLESGVPEGSGVAPRGPGVPPPDTYTVRPGDTLWDLSGRFLNNPWYWPKVWSYNPEITNAHWIYPGNVVRFFPATEEAPARVEPVPAGEVAAAPAEEPVAPRELEDLSRAERGKAPDYGDEDAVAVVGPHKVGYVAPRGVQARRDTFVTVRELERSGEVTAAFEDKAILTIHDRLYARLAEPAKVGQVLTLFRTVRPVQHPRTGNRIGYQTRLLGSARVVAQDEKATTLVVTRAVDTIERGDRISPAADRLVKMVARRPNQRQLSGLIVASEIEAAWMSADNHLVFVDKGRTDGVEEGNVFTVTRAGDPYGHVLSAKTLAPPEDARLPTEDIGELLVLDAKENFSTALVLRSLRELFAGDRVEMRTGTGPTASR